MSSAEQPVFRWRSIALPALLPTLLFAIGSGAIIPIIPVVASRLGEDLFDDLPTVLAVAGVISALIMIGELIGNIPSGWLVSRVGERPAMIGAALFSIVGLAVCLLSTTPWMLGVGVFIVGLATAVFALARHAYMTTAVPRSHRARALSTLGGLFRLGYFVGPFLTAGALTIFGGFEAAFWIHIVMCLATAGVLLLVGDPPETHGRTPGEELVEREAIGLFRTIAARRDVLVRMGTGAAIISGLRAARTVVLPLWAVSIGLDDVTTALIIGIAAGVDFALFYSGGWIMDRYGRLWTALPSALGLSLGFIALSLTHEADARVGWFVGLAMVMAVANGIGSGILMTLAADLADPVDPAPFLGAFRFTSGLGNASAPVLVAGITAVSSLSIAAAAMGGLGVLGALILLRYVPRYASRTPPA
jgi:MFS family permease